MPNSPQARYTANDIPARFEPEHIPATEGQRPQRATNESSGLDLRADVEHAEMIKPGNSTLIPTGLHLDLPDHLEAQVRPRSGLAYKHGVTVLNTPGTIDSDYRGNIGVILINHSDHPFPVHPGDRIAQIVICPVQKVGFKYESDLEETERADGGFGHTGTQ